MLKIRKSYLFYSIVLFAFLSQLPALAQETAKSETRSEIGAQTTSTTTVGGSVIPKKCISWFDGCNTCTVVDGKTALCTEKFCETTTATSKCLAYSPGEVNNPGTISETETSNLQITSYVKTGSIEASEITEKSNQNIVTEIKNTETKTSYIFSNKTGESQAESSSSNTNQDGSSSLKEKTIVINTRVGDEVTVVEDKIVINNEKTSILPEEAIKTAAEVSKTSFSEINIDKNKKNEIVYEVIGVKESLLFGIFGKNMTVKTEINAETGTVIKVRKPWWGFLARE